jgi:hypothetical protein
MLYKTACLLKVQLDDDYFVWSVAVWCLSHGIYTRVYTGKAKVHPRTVHEGPEGGVEV